MVEIAGYYDEHAEPSASFDALPAGDYRAVIIESEMQDISKHSEKGRCLALTWRIETGPYDGRLFWQRLNMWGQNMTNNDKVVSIANSQFAAVREATGVLTPKNTEELHDRPCLVRLKITKSEGYPDRNDVVSVKSVGGSAPAQPAANNGNRLPPPPAANKAPAASGGGSMPWGQR